MTTWTYNNANRQVTRTATGAEGPCSETTTSDAFGRIASMLNALGTFTWNYSGTDPRPGSITHSGGFDTEFTYDPLASGGHLATLASKLPGGATIAKHSYTRDTLGQIATWKREAPLANPGTTHQYQWTLAHDFSGQLTSVIEKDLTGGLRGSHAFAYDAASNRTSLFSAQAGATAKAMTAAHNSMNQITTLGYGGRSRVAEPRRCWTAPAKGAFGDRRRRFLGWRLHTQSGVPRQVGVPAALQHHGNTFCGAGWRQPTLASGKTTTFHYNALGERTKMVHTDGSTTRTEYYLYDGPRPIQRRSVGTATSNIDREYFAGGERRWNTGTGAWVNHHFTRDHLGSVREVLDSSGALLARYDDAPYGERTTRYEASGYSCDVGFTGHFLLPSLVSGQSEILLAHYRAYDPVLGRWLSQDPIRELGGINLYGYVGGRVLSSTDIFGLNPDQWSLPHYQDLLMRVESEVPPGGGVEGGGVHIHDLKSGLKYDYNTKTGLFTCRGDQKGRRVGQALPKEIRNAIQSNREIQTKIQRALDRVSGSTKGFAPKFGGGKAGKFLPLLVAVGLGVTADAVASRYLAEAQKGGNGYHYLQAAYDLATALPAPDAMQSALLLELAEPPVFAPEDPCQEAVP